jgi:hypothetical protein
MAQRTLRTAAIHVFRDHVYFFSLERGAKVLDEVRVVHRPVAPRACESE